MYFERQFKRYFKMYSDAALMQRRALPFVQRRDSSKNKTAECAHLKQARSELPGLQLERQAVSLFAPPLLQPLMARCRLGHTRNLQIGFPP